MLNNSVTKDKFFILKNRGGKEPQSCFNTNHSATKDCDKLLWKVVFFVRKTISKSVSIFWLTCVTQHPKSQVKQDLKNSLKERFQNGLI